MAPASSGSVPTYKSYNIPTYSLHSAQPTQTAASKKPQSTLNYMYLVPGGGTAPQTLASVPEAPPAHSAVGRLISGQNEPFHRPGPVRVYRAKGTMPTRVQELPQPTYYQGNTKVSVSYNKPH